METNLMSPFYKHGHVLHAGLLSLLNENKHHRERCSALRLQTANYAVNCSTLRPSLFYLLIFITAFCLSFIGLTNRDRKLGRERERGRNAGLESNPGQCSKDTALGGCTLYQCSY